MIGTTWESHDSSPPPGSSVELVNARAVRAKLVDRFSRLPALSQVVVNLFFRSDMGLDQIAGLLDLPREEIETLWRETLHHLCVASIEGQEERNG